MVRIATKPFAPIQPITRAARIAMLLVHYHVHQVALLGTVEIVEPALVEINHARLARVAIPVADVQPAAGIVHPPCGNSASARARLSGIWSRIVIVASPCVAM